MEYDLTTDGLLVPIAGSEERNLCSLYVGESGNETFFRFDVPTDVRRVVAALEPQEVFASPENVVERLGGRSAARYETYVAEVPVSSMSPVRSRFSEGRFVVDGPDGQPASWAWSVRESNYAAECAVETVEHFRRRGLASAVVAAWVNAVLTAAKVPFYSHASSNDASRALAVRLGLTHAFTVFSVE